MFGDSDDPDLPKRVVISAGSGSSRRAVQVNLRFEQSAKVPPIPPHQQSLRDAMRQRTAHETPHSLQLSRHLRPSRRLPRHPPRRNAPPPLSPVAHPLPAPRRPPLSETPESPSLSTRRSLSSRHRLLPAVPLYRLPTSTVPAGIFSHTQCRLYLRADGSPRVSPTPHRVE